MRQIVSRRNFIHSLAVGSVDTGSHRRIRSFVSVCVCAVWAVCACQFKSFLLLFFVFWIDVDVESKLIFRIIHFRIDCVRLFSHTCFVCRRHCTSSISSQRQFRFGDMKCCLLLWWVFYAKEEEGKKNRIANIQHRTACHIACRQISFRLVPNDDFASCSCEFRVHRFAVFLTLAPAHALALSFSPRLSLSLSFSLLLLSTSREQPIICESKAHTTYN